MGLANVEPKLKYLLKKKWSLLFLTSSQMLEGRGSFQGVQCLMK